MFPFGRSAFRWNKSRDIWLWIIIIAFFGLVRWSKGTIFADSYAFISRPFWPGPTQKDWIFNGVNLENQSRIELLEEDNKRLRKMLSIQDKSKKNLISAAVIFRPSTGWWHQMELGKGSLNGVSVGNAVIGPGGLLGRVNSVTPTTSRVRLLTSPGSKIGVWVPRIKRHGILMGKGSSRPILSFIDKKIDVIPGDVISTSPASTLLPPNLPIGVIQKIDKKSIPVPFATVQLIVAPEAIDWVQIQVR